MFYDMTPPAGRNLGMAKCHTIQRRLDRLPPASQTKRYKKSKNLVVGGSAAWIDEQDLVKIISGYLVRCPVVGGDFLAEVTMGYPVVVEWCLEK